MPRKNKSKGKQPKTSTESTTLRLPKVENVEGWNKIIEEISAFFKLPGKRSGLKQAHVEFDAIFGKLVLAYQLSGNAWKLKGGVAGIIAKLSVDSRLRDKLCEEGILNLVAPLLKVSETRHIALQSIACIARHGDLMVYTEIMQHAAGKLLTLLEYLPDDEKVTEFCVMIFALSVPPVVQAGPPNQPASQFIQKMLDLVLKAIRRPRHPSPLLVEHTVDLIRMITKKTKDWIVRSKCLSGLLDLYKPVSEDDQILRCDLMHLETASRRLTPRLRGALNARGEHLSEMWFSFRCNNDNKAAILKFEEDRDLYSLGLELAKLIGAQDTMLREYDAEKRHPVDGLPPASSVEILPHAAAAIRARGVPGEEDLADILDLKYYAHNNRLRDVVALVKKGLQRNPNQGYYHYNMVFIKQHLSSPLDALMSAKKGLKCGKLSPLLRRALLHMAIYLSGDVGFDTLAKLTDSEVGDERWEKGIAFIMSAYEDAKTLLNEAPPDCKYLKDAGYWSVLLSVLIREDLSPDLRELEHDLKRLKLSQEFYQCLFKEPPRDVIRMTQEAIVKHYSTAVRDFGPLFTTLDEAKSARSPLPDVKAGITEDDIEDWFERIISEDPKDPLFSPKYLRTINFDHVTLYRCSWCGNPSAALRKCSRCTTALYCDGDCQKSHWPVHRKACNRV